MIKMDFCVSGLNPYDRDLLYSKVSLVISKLCPVVDLDCSMVKSEPNTIWFNHVFSDDDEDLVFELSHILNGLEFRESDYERCVCNPCFNLSVTFVDNNYGVV